MPTSIETVTKAYTLLSKIPALVGARLNVNNSIVTSVWSQRNLERGKTTKFQRTFVLNKNLENISETLPIDVSNELLSAISPSENLRAVLRELDSKQYLEIWQNTNLSRTVDLAALDAHGTVYTDAELGTGLQWSPDERKILYIAELKPPKSEPFYKRKKDQDKGDEDKDKKASKGEEYLFTEDWGEQMVGKKQSVIAQYDIENDSVEILKGVPEDICPGQVIYSPKGDFILGIGFDTKPRKLGIIYCGNRAGTIFKLDYQGVYTTFPLPNKSVRGLRIAPDGDTLIWLQRDVGGPHWGAMALMKTSLAKLPEFHTETIVDIVDTKILTENGKEFYGLYNSGFIRRCFVTKNHLVVSTQQQYTIKTYLINIDSGKFSEIPFDDGSQVVLDAHNDLILLNRRNYLKSDSLVVLKVQDGSEIAVQVTASENIPGWENLSVVPLELCQTVDDSVKEFNAIYLGPKTGAEKSVPLVAWPHGGPHSSFANFFILEAALFLQMGWGIVFINYRGSIGAGEKCVNFLRGKVGTSDVADCVLAIKTVLKQCNWLDDKRVGLVGGSHGGFLVAHLSGQYPDMFKVVAARNPVIDIASMSILSDIPDWCYVEAGYQYTQQGPINDEILLKMRKASPIEHAHKVKSPTLLQIGSKDLRVPYNQGLEYYTRLKSNSVKVRMNLYDDNHPLGSVPNEMDNVINTVLWLDQHL